MPPNNTKAPLKRKMSTKTHSTLTTGDKTKKSLNSVFTAINMPPLR